jgi:hypothetical protein
MKEISIDNSGSKSISSIMFSPVEEDTHQKRMDSMELSWMSVEIFLFLDIIFLEGKM